MTEASDKSAPLLECRDLAISYTTRAGAVPAVAGFNLTLDRGESLGLVGESGCGKSTVAMAILRYLGRNGATTGGTIHFQGRDMAELTREELRRLRGNRIAMVYQEPMAALNPSMTIGRQLLEVPRTHTRLTRREAEEAVRQVLTDVHLPDQDRLLAAYPHQLSGGQQQRVVIAMALLANPDLLILDEPTTALDVTVEAGIVALIGELARRREMALLYISHNLGLIRESCQRIMVMYSGEVVESGPTERVFHDMRHPYTRGLFSAIPTPLAGREARRLVAIPGQPPLPQERPLGCNFAPRCGLFQAGRCDAGEIPLTRIEEEVPHAVRCLRWAEVELLDPEPPRREERPSPKTSETGPRLVVEELSKRYRLDAPLFGGAAAGREVRANTDISLSAEAGETLAVVGESGCGKSTLAKLLMGLEKPNGGRILFRGEALEELPVEARSREQIGALQMVFQNPSDTLNPSRSIGEQLGRTLKRFGVVSGRATRQRVEDLLERVNLPRAFATRRPRQLSGGQKQRVGIARAFAGNPDLVVADEPVSALDVSVAAAVTDLLSDIQQREGTTLIFISHDLALVRHLADSVVVMYLGRIVEQGRTQAVFEPPYHPYTEALLAAVPLADARVAKRSIVLEGAPPSPLAPPSGCPFHTRCPRKLGAVCESEVPPLRDLDNGHKIACHIPAKTLRAVAPVFSKAEGESV